MLQKEAVVPEVINLIKELQSNSLFKDHILVGGTALTLQLGHRTSTDVDLFTPKTQNAIALMDHFRRNYKNVEIEYFDNDFTRIYVNGIKVEMVQYEEIILEEPKNEDGIRLLGINEIAAMKLNTIAKRTQARDFIDIAYLLREISLEKMFDLYKERYGSVSPLYMKRTLLKKSKNIKDNEWLVGGIKMLRHEIEPKDVPVFIEKAIEKYNRKMNIGKI
jgi:predicted nucleotidyltransferase component of viral defense system